VSSVQPLLTFHEVPFDWSKIDVATDLKITASADGFEIKDDGAGPAVAVKYRVATGALDLIRGEYPYLLNRTANLSFSRPTLPVRALELDHETPPGLVDRAYRPIAEVPIGAPTRADTDPSILRCGGSRFEIITTLARLSELAPVVRGGTATLEISFETLRGKVESRSASAPLPADLVQAHNTSRGVALYGDTPQLQQMWSALDGAHAQFNPDNAVRLFEQIWAGHGGERYGKRHQHRVAWMRAGLGAALVASAAPGAKSMEPA